MPSENIDLNVGINNTKNVTVTANVTLTKEFRVRQWLAAQFIKLAILSLGAKCDMTVELEKEVRE